MTRTRNAANTASRVSRTPHNHGRTIALPPLQAATHPARTPMAPTPSHTYCSSPGCTAFSASEQRLPQVQYIHIFVSFEVLGLFGVHFGPTYTVPSPGICSATTCVWLPTSYCLPPTTTPQYAGHLEDGAVLAVRRQNLNAVLLGQGQDERAACERGWEGEGWEGGV